MLELDFKDKVVVVTGASSGIGAATAKSFAQYGAKLTIVGRDESRLSKVARECEIKSQEKPLSILLDLAEEGSCEAIIKKTTDHFGKINILINCAGVFKQSSLFDSEIAAFDEMMLINFRVPYLLTKLAIPHLIQTRGCIVNVGSSMVNSHKRLTIPYLVSKSALKSFTMQAAEHLAKKGVRINIVNPGVTKTNLLRHLNLTEPLMSKLIGCLKIRNPRQELIDPAEIASLILWCCNDELPNVNGSSFAIDSASSFLF